MSTTTSAETRPALTRDEAQRLLDLAQAVTDTAREDGASLWRDSTAEQMKAAHQAHVTAHDALVKAIVDHTDYSR